MKMDALGRHIIVEYYNCDSEILRKPQLIEEYMRKAAVLAQATIVESFFHHFSPWGVSGAVIISESHLTIHTWPEYGYAAVDLFTCGDLEPWKGFDYLEKAFGAQYSESMEIARGMTDKIRKFCPKNIGPITHKPIETLEAI